jgi:hypothetical protein
MKRLDARLGAISGSIFLLAVLWLVLSIHTNG